MSRKIKLSLITLLSIGSISIASLPLVSCGNSETTPTTPPPTPVVSTLDTESAKLKSQTTKITNELAETANDKIQNAADQNAELKRYYEVELSEGFSYRYASSSYEGSTLNVIVELVYGSSTISVKIAIIGFTTFNIEEAKLVTQATEITNESALLAKTNIDGATNKDVQLARYYKTIVLSSEFSYKYVSSSYIDSTLNVIVELTGTGSTDNNGNTKSVNIAITGFVSFSSQESKLISKSTKINDESPLRAMTNINDAVDKNVELAKYYGTVELENGFIYTYLSSAIADSTLNVTVTLVGNGETTEVTFGITGFVNISNITIKTQSELELVQPKYKQSAEKMLKNITDGTNEMKLSIAQEFFNGLTNGLTIDNISRISVNAHFDGNDFSIELTNNKLFPNPLIITNLASASLDETPKALWLTDDYLSIINGKKQINMDKIKTNYPSNSVNPNHPDSYNGLMYLPNFSNNVQIIQPEFLNYFKFITTFMKISNDADNINGNFQKLEQLSTGNYLEVIGDYAFGGNSLRSLTLGESVTTIGKHAFRQNYLVSLVIPDSVRIIDNYAFENNKLTSLTLGNLVTTIGINAFRHNSLSRLGNKLIIPNSVITIRDWAFYDNGIWATIPDIDHVTNQGKNIFSNLK